MLFSLIYISKAIRPMQRSDLNLVLEESLSKNSRHQITGMLLYVQGKFVNEYGARFMQVLEGEEAAVRQIYDKIKQDSRHYNVRVVDQLKIKQRNFTSWSMSFKSMSTEEFDHLPGHFELDRQFLDSKNSTKINVPLTFLKSFYSMNAMDNINHSL